MEIACVELEKAKQSRHMALYKCVLIVYYWFMYRTLWNGELGTDGW